MPYDIVFVSNTSRTERPYFDPSVRYRVFNPGEYLRRRGHRVTLVAQSVFEQHAETFASARTVVLHRPQASEAMLQYVLRNRDRQTLVADYDDLVFDVAAAADTPAVADRGEPLDHVARALASNAEIGALLPLRSASTGPLAEAAAELLGGRSHVIRNALDPIYLDIVRCHNRAPRPAPDFDLGYFSGTASHNADFALIAPAVAEYLAERPKARFLLVGPVALPEALARHSDRIVREKVRSFHVMPELLTRCRMVVGPLLENRFTRCKSGLKFFEAAVLGVPVAATPIPDIDRFDSPLLFKCRSAEDWAAAFRAELPPEPELRAAAEEVARATALAGEMARWEAAFVARAADDH